MINIYAIGCIISFILGCYEAYSRQKHNKNIEEFPVMISFITLLSWVYVIMRIIKPIRYE